MPFGHQKVTIQADMGDTKSYILDEQKNIQVLYFSGRHFFSANFSSLLLVC